ncbi:hypothetical protein X753_16805 [Mesorhizobium sp. LNJC399B00]|nr:hypothetical protein X770_12650 [Mesorhizobium sp. LSJC269B00]ESY05226.1 hypothetical protein X753_16805 [Mesorhizobium sp. LNJC399B00]
MTVPAFAVAGSVNCTGVIAVEDGRSEKILTVSTLHCCGRFSAPSMVMTSVRPSLSKSRRMADVPDIEEIE